MTALKGSLATPVLNFRHGLLIRNGNSQIKCRKHGWQKYRAAINTTIDAKIDRSFLCSFGESNIEASFSGNLELKRYYTTLSNPGRGPLNNSRILSYAYLSPALGGYAGAHVRFIGGWVGAIARSVLKIRYLVLGGALGGGASLAKQYEDWKSGLPDTEWIKSLFPSDNEIDKFRSGLIKAGENIKGKANEIDIDPVLSKIEGYKKWFTKRLNDAVVAADTSASQIKNSSNESTGENVPKSISLPAKGENGSNGGNNNGNNSDWRNLAIPITSALAVTSVGGSDKENNKKLEEERKKTEEERIKNLSLQKKLESAQEELMRTQIRYQKELERLEKENKDLKQRLLLKTNSAMAKKQIKKSLIDMYSEILDELSGYDSSYSHADHLPRVVVIGKKDPLDIF